MNRMWLRFSLAALISGALAVQAQDLITQPVDNAIRVTLLGNTRPEATAANDRGPVADNLELDDVQLVLGRSRAQQAALEEFLANLENPRSPDYHQWITAAQFGQKFGLSAQDLKAVTGWLESKGFTINVVYPHGVIDFSGTAAEVRSAFGTTIYNLTPLFTAGYSGKGQSIVLIEDTYLYSLGDWTTFRKEFGLARLYPFATLTQESPAPATGT